MIHIEDPGLTRRLYREAADKSQQVEILSQLNGCTVKEMAQWLREQGFEVGNYKPKRRGLYKVRPELEEEAVEKLEMETETEKTAGHTESEKEGTERVRRKKKRMETPEEKMGNPGEKGGIAAQEMGNMGEKVGIKEKPGVVTLMPEEVAVLNDYITAFQTTVVSEDHYSVMGNRLVGALDAILSVAEARNRKV